MSEYQTDHQWMELLRSDEPGIIRTREDWEAFLNDAERVADVFPDCDDETIKAFGEGLIFRGLGLAGADYSMLIDRLTYRKFYEVWATLFGMAANVFEDHKEYYCAKRATCNQSQNQICTSNC